MASDSKKTVAVLISLIVGIIIMVVLFEVVPLVGQSMDNAVKIPAGSAWDENNVTASGLDLWNSTAPLMYIPVVMLIIGLIIGGIMIIRRDADSNM